MKKVLNLEYGSLHGTYWMGYGIVSTFASVLLLGRGYSNSDIGVILAVSNVLAVIMQPILADVADRSKKITMIDVCQLGGVILMGFMAAIALIGHKSLALSVVYVLAVAGLVALQPLLNSLCFYLESSGVDINFGITRSAGSFAYAVMCAFLGGVVEKNGVQILPMCGLVFLAAFVTCLFAIRHHFNKACRLNSYSEGKAVSEVETKEDIDLMMFVKRNKTFFIMSIGVLGIFFSNSVLNSFMIQIIEPIGGTSEDMGKIFGFLAFLEIPTMVFFDKINEKISCQKLLKIASVSYVIKIFVTFAAGSVSVVFWSQLLQLITFAVFLPAIVEFTNQVMSEGEAAKGQMLFTVMSTGATVISSLMGGWILDISGPKMLLLVSTIFTAAGTVVLFMTIDKIKHSPNIK